MEASGAPGAALSAEPGRGGWIAIARQRPIAPPASMPWRRPAAVLHRCQPGRQCDRVRSPVGLPRFSIW